MDKHKFIHNKTKQQLLQLFDEDMAIEVSNIGFRTYDLWTILKISSIFRRHIKMYDVGISRIQEHILHHIVTTLGFGIRTDCIFDIANENYVEYCMQDLISCMPEYCIEYNYNSEHAGIGCCRLVMRNIRYNNEYILTRESNYSKSRFCSKIFPRDLLHILQCFLG